MKTDVDEAADAQNGLQLNELSVPISAQVTDPKPVEKPTAGRGGRKGRRHRTRANANDLSDRLFKEFVRLGSIGEAAKLCGVSRATAYKRRRQDKFDERADDARKEAARKSGLTLEASNLETLGILRVVKSHLHAQAKAWQTVAAPEPGKPTMDIEDLSEQIRELAKTEQLLLGGVTERVGHKTWEEEVAEARQAHGGN